MPKLERFVRRASLFAAASVAIALLTAPYSGWSATRPAPIVPTIGSVALQIGLRMPPQADAEFVVGTQFSSSLEDAPKLASLGLKGFHVGVRVAVARIAPDRVHIEADEFDPPRREFVRVSLDANGRLAPSPKSLTPTVP